MLMAGGVSSRTVLPRTPPNESNLMMAGRPSSCSYVAFASSRVLSTGSIVGQAVGVAAALCNKHATTPRDVAKHHAQECQQMILRQDGHIPGVVNEDQNDLARRAVVMASSQWRLEFPNAENDRELKLPHAQLFPVSSNRIERVELQLESQLDRAVELRLGLRPAAHVWDFRAAQDIALARATVPAHHRGWLAFNLIAKVEPEKLYYVYTSAQPGISWKVFKDGDGQPNRCPVGTTAANLRGGKTWRAMTGGQSLALRLAPESKPYTATNIISGTNRPDKWTNIWISDPQASLPQWVELRWSSTQHFNTVQLTFDTDQNRRVTLPLFRYPDCVKDYRLEYQARAGWKTLAEVKDNYVRRRIHRFDIVHSESVRLIVLATNGAPSARVYEVRIYRED
ncbi:MAG TPA: FAD-dependent oxidoreductase [Pyrinomonadaceae bacterium]